MRESRLPEAVDGTFDTLVADMDRAQVARTLATVFVTAKDDLFATVAAGLRRHRGRLAAQLNLPPNRPAWAASNLRTAAGEPAVAGARAALSLFKVRPVDEALEQVWDACEAAALPVQVVLDASRYSDPRTFETLARERPRLTLVLSIARARYRAALPALARFPSIYFQLPGLLDAEIQSGDPALLRWAVRRLPHERLMFGSDRLGREASYFRKVRAIGTLPTAARDRIGRMTALEVYGRRLAGWAPP